MPVVRMNGNVCVLPGVPRIFTALLHALPEYLALDPNMPRPIRKLIHTDLPESALAPVRPPARLPVLTTSCSPGSRTRARRKTSVSARTRRCVSQWRRAIAALTAQWNDGVHVSLIGYEADVLEKYVSQVVNETDGHLIDNP